MALVLNTNCGFVTSAPIADPGATFGTIDDYTIAFKVTSPADISQVTEMGWWQDYGSNSSEAYNMAIYEHDAVGDEPGAVVAGTEQSGNSSAASSSQWNKYTGLSLSLSQSHDYWLAVGMDNATTVNRLDYQTNETGQRYQYQQIGAGDLIPDPWGDGTGTEQTDRLISIYAVYTTGGAATTKTRRRVMSSCIG